MDRFHMMNVFVAVVEEESLAAGSRRLHISPSAVTRAIAALENRLSVKLLNRTTRFVRMTEAGQKFYDDTKRILALADEAEADVQGINTEPRGPLTITAPVLFGRQFVMPGIIEYSQRYPKVEVNALFIDRIMNMLDEGVDVAIRIASLPDSTYRALKVGTVRRVLCASPEYLSMYGTPKCPEELANHKMILARGITPANEMRFLQDGKIVTVKLQPVLSVNDNNSAIHAAISGLGITRLYDYQIADAVQMDKLKIVLKEYELEPVPVHIVHREGRNFSTKIRSFVDLMTIRLRLSLASIDRSAR